MKISLLFVLHPLYEYNLKVVPKNHKAKPMPTYTEAELLAEKMQMRREKLAAGKTTPLPTTLEEMAALVESRNIEVKRRLEVKRAEKRRRLGKKTKAEIKAEAEASSPSEPEIKAARGGLEEKSANPRRRVRKTAKLVRSG
jgi:hypothetical protein